MRSLSEHELWQINLYPLRIYARSIGVARPTARKKEELVRAILDVQDGTVPPTRNTRGRKPIMVLNLTPPDPDASLPPRQLPPEGPTPELEPIDISVSDPRYISPKSLASAKTYLRESFEKVMSSNHLRELEHLKATLDIILLHLRGQ